MKKKHILFIQRLSLSRKSVLDPADVYELSGVTISGPGSLKAITHNRCLKDSDLGEH